MPDKYYEVEPSTLFSKSLIWQLNRDFYQNAGINAWSDGVVPHNLTSNSRVGKTYAELIWGFLKDLATKGQTKETVYILDLGAGQGRLAFHILKHLDRLRELLDLELPPYCYVVSDIVEDNLSFFQNHPQFQTYLENGLLDITYFDAIESKEIYLRHSQVKVIPQDLQQPIIAIANYFFDSIPNDLFQIKNQLISACSITLESKENPKEMSAESLLKDLRFSFQKNPLKKPFYADDIFNEILENYKYLIKNSHVFFPQKGLQCLHNLRKLSRKGLMVLTMDKGFHEIHDLENKGEPEMVTHGSFSIWVNYHAIGSYCKKQGGKTLYPAFSNFYLDLGCLLFVPESEKFTETNNAYQRFVNDFGPDDYNGIKRLTYNHISRLSLKELIALIRLYAYDSTFFIKVLPRLKQVVKQVSFNERIRFSQTMHEVWNMYFSINESFDLAYELGGLFYDFGLYNDALTYFQNSINAFGLKEDIYYNQILCYYQLRQDSLFLETLKEAKAVFPEYTRFEYLERLDLGAK